MIIEKKPGMTWTAVRTKPRCEKIVAQHCQQNELCHYLPLRRRAKRYQRRTVETFLPMFPGYVFVQLGEAEKAILARSHKIVASLPIDAAMEATLITELGELQQLEQASLENELIVQPELSPGRKVLIPDGPLKGLAGIVERRQSKARVTVNVEILGQSVSVDIDIGDVQLEDD